MSVISSKLENNAYTTQYIIHFTYNTTVSYSYCPSFYTLSIFLLQKLP